MRHLVPQVLSMICVCGIAAPAIAFVAPPAQAPRTFVAPEDRNAAIRYLVAVAAISPEVSVKVRELDWKEIGDNVDPAKMPQAFTDLAKLPIDGVIRYVIEGSQMSRCNFEFNYEAGINTLIPQLGYMRQLSRIVRFDARLLQTQGKADDAADRLIALLRLSKHLMEDGWLINVLTAAAIDYSAFDEIGVLSRSPNLSAAKRADLLAALETRNTPDPLNFANAMQTERTSILPHLEAEAAKANGSKIIAEMLGDQPVAASVATLSNPELQAQVAKLSSMYDEFALAVSPQTSDEQAARIQADVAAGKFGVLGAAFMPGADTLRSSRKRYLASLANAIQAVKAPAPAK